MNQRLTSKRVIITGGASGIGKGAGKRMAAEGAEVHIVDLNLEEATTVSMEIEQEGGKAYAHSCDISDYKAVQTLYKKIIEEDPVDILVNSAGIAHIGNIENTTEDDLDRLYRQAR
jgi:2-keto-3-deoxy-L-fuconate dehydrogenase